MVVDFCAVVILVSGIFVMMSSGRWIDIIGFRDEGTGVWQVACPRSADENDNGDVQSANFGVGGADWFLVEDDALESVMGGAGGMCLVCDDDMLFADKIDMSDSVGDGKLFSGLDGEVIGL